MGQLKDRMATVMKIHGLANSTQKHYLAEMVKFTKFFNVSPDKLTKEHIYQYQDYLVNQKKVSYSALKIIVNSLRFFYNKVMGFEWMLKYIPYQKKELNFLQF
jgi:hypothetical protein